MKRGQYIAVTRGQEVCNMKVSLSLCIILTWKTADTVACINFHKMVVHVARIHTKSISMFICAHITITVKVALSYNPKAKCISREEYN